MTPSAIILAALSIISANAEAANLDAALGQNKESILAEVQTLSGSDLTKIRDTIDLLTKYDLNIQRGELNLAKNTNSVGVSYSTDPLSKPSIGHSS